MQKIILIAVGGAIGTIFRYIVSNVDYKLSSSVFPVSTFLVNILGSLVIGILWGLFERFTIAPEIRMFIVIGIIGGFTTFSTFSLENFNLLRSGEIRIALFNILATNFIGITFVFAGFYAAKLLITLNR